MTCASRYGLKRWLLQRQALRWGCLLSLLFGSSRCTPSEDAAPDKAAESASRREVAEALAASAPAAPINDVLDRWSAGQREEAIVALLAMYDSHASAAAYRPFDFTEAQFVALPPADRDSLRERMLTRIEVLRQGVVKEMEKRGREEIVAGRFDEAERTFLTMKQLGAANRSPDVTLLMGLVGKRIEEIADTGRADLARARAGSQTTKPR